MASAKRGQLTRYCRILQWIEDKDNDLACAIRDLCLDNMLVPREGSPGVTFLYPKEKEYRDEIVRKAYSNDADDAVKLICSLIIPVALHSTNDFKENPPGSRLGVKYEVKSVSEGAVDLAGGVKLTPANDFHPLTKCTGKLLAVWYVDAGRLPLSGESYKAPQMVSRSRILRTGGDGGDGGISRREQLALTTEEAFKKGINQPMTSDPYLVVVVSILHWLRINQSELYTTLLPFLDWSPFITFYLLVQPYKKKGGYLIPDNILYGDDTTTAWNGVTPTVNSYSTEYESIISSIAGQAEKTADDQGGNPVVPRVFSDPSSVKAEIETVRKDILATTDLSGCIDKVIDVYAKLRVGDTMGDLSAVESSATIAATPGSMSLWMDEFRFLIFAELAQVLKNRNPQGIVSENGIGEIIKTIRTDWRGDDYDAERQITKPPINQGASALDTTQLHLLKFWVNSSAFLHFAGPAGGQSGSIYFKGSNSAQVFNNYDQIAERFLVDNNRLVATGGGRNARSYHEHQPCKASARSYHEHQPCKAPVRSYHEHQPSQPCKAPARSYHGHLNLNHQ